MNHQREKHKLPVKLVEQISSIVWFANAVELYQKKNHNCFRSNSPDHLVKDCPKDLNKVARKVNLNAKEGMTKGRPDSSETSSHSTNILGQGSQSLKMSQKISFFNPNPLNQWGRPESIARVQIDGEDSWAFMDSGSTML